VCWRFTRWRSPQRHAPGSDPSRAPTASQAAAGQHRITLGELYLKLPQGPSRVQDSWTSPITFIADLNTRQLYEAAANHKIEELKWMQDIEALRIRSYATLPAVITLPQNITLTGVSVTRDTWFAYKERRILRIEDTITAQAQVPVAAIGSSAAIPTMPQFPGPGLPTPRAGNAAEEEFAFQGGNPGLRFEPSGASAERLREETFQRRRPAG